MTEPTENKDASKLPANYYVDNKVFYEAIVAYRDQCQQAEAAGLPRPKIPEYIGACILKIARRLTYAPRFIRWPAYHDDMIGDGIENCVRYFHNFNPEKSKNPFSYFTQCLYYAFMGTIENETTERYIRQKALQNMLASGDLSEELDFSEDGGKDLGSLVDTDRMDNFIKSYEGFLETRRAKRSAKTKEAVEKKRGLDAFIETEKDA